MMISTNEESDWWSANIVGGKSSVEGVQIKRAGSEYLRAFEVKIDDKVCGEVPEGIKDIWYTVKCPYALDGSTVKISTTAKDSHFALYEVKAIKRLPRMAMLEDCTKASKVSLTKDNKIMLDKGGKCLSVVKDTHNLKYEDCDSKELEKWEFLYDKQGYVKIKSLKHPKYLYAEKFGETTGNNEYKMGFNLKYGV
jgi:hypothetical protein